MKWQEMPEGKEKYAAYLCSREWSVLKQAVHDRADGMCERCLTRPIGSVHHMTYARKYSEKLADLQGLCSGCHEFIHGKTNIDPREIEERESRPMRVFSRESDLYVDLGAYVVPLQTSLALSIWKGLCDPGDVRAVVESAIRVGIAMRDQDQEATDG